MKSVPIFLLPFLALMLAGCVTTTQSKTEWRHPKYGTAKQSPDQYQKAVIRATKAMNAVLASAPAPQFMDSPAAASAPSAYNFSGTGRYYDSYGLQTGSSTFTGTATPQGNAVGSFFSAYQSGLSAGYNELQMHREAMNQAAAAMAFTQCMKDQGWVQVPVEPVKK